MFIFSTKLFLVEFIFGHCFGSKFIPIDLMDAIKFVSGFNFVANSVSTYLSWLISSVLRSALLTPRDRLSVDPLNLTRSLELLVAKVFTFVSVFMGSNILEICKYTTN